MYLSLYSELGDALSITQKELYEACVTRGQHDVAAQGYFSQGRLKAVAEEFVNGIVPGEDIGSCCLVEVDVAGVSYVILDRFVPSTRQYVKTIVRMSDGATDIKHAEFLNGVVPFSTYSQVCVINEHTPLLTTLSPREMLETLKSLFTAEDDATPKLLEDELDKVKAEAACAKAMYEQAVARREITSGGSPDCKVCASNANETEIRELMVKYEALKERVTQVRGLITEHTSLVNSILPMLVETIRATANNLFAKHNASIDVKIETTVRGRAAMKGLVMLLHVDGEEGGVRIGHASGYQRLLADLAVRQAIHAIYDCTLAEGANRLAGAPLLFIDEGLHRADDSNIAGVGEILCELIGTYCGIFVVSHDPTITIESDNDIVVIDGYMKVV